MSLQIYRIVGVLFVSALFLVGMMAASLDEAQGDEKTKAENAKAPVVTAKATFAGGCFWCMEPPFDKLDGVISTTSGYTGGAENNPTYKQVSRGETGHAEAIEIVFDPAIISYAALLDVFWHNIDPTTADRQFCDGGHQYRTAIFYHDDAQKILAESTRDAIAAAGRVKPVLTQIVPAGDFWEAEGYHQDYYKKNPDSYNEYRFNCGRDQRLRQLWGESSSAKH